MRKHDASRTSGSSARMVEVRVRGRNFASARLAVRRSFLALRFHEDPTRVADELTLGLVQDVVAMVRSGEVLVPIYRELWKQDLDLDTFRAASYVHDAAKVIEFVEKEGALTAIPGYNHAIEAGRIVRELGGPEPLAHMIEAHSFAGALVVPRTRDAQLFLMLDPMCLNVFPEQGLGVVERHLKANGWDDPKTLERYRSPGA